MYEIEPYFENPNIAILLLVGCIAIAFSITYIAIPSIVSVAQVKKLYDIPNARASHTQVTPLLGGIAIFAGLIISTTLFSIMGFGGELKYIIAGLIILFFVGIKDDILNIDPYKKLIAQVLVALLIAILGNVRITHLHGFLGIEEINYLFSILFTVFFYIVLTNGFNLIDGIDGLASGVGIITSTTFGTWFAITGHLSYAVMSFALVGALIAFFYFNVFNKRYKIFLGDTGSLILGFSIAVFAIRFMEYGLKTTGIARIESAHAVAFGILIIPLFDTFRVFMIRILQKKSPFTADKQHIHHRLLDLGFTHLKATLLLIAINLFFIGLSLILNQIGDLNLIGIQLFLASFLSYIMMILVRFKHQDQYLKNLSPTEETIEYKKHINNPDGCPLQNSSCPLGYKDETIKDNTST